MQPGNAISPLRFFSRPGPQAEQRSGADQPVGVGWSAPFLWVLEGWGHGRRIADCGHTPTKPGVSKGGLGLPLGTRPCLQGVVCYTCRRGCRGKRGAVLFAPRLHRQGNGRGFVTGREQKARSFSESGGRYISPRPSSPAGGTKCPKGGGSRAPKIKRGGQAPSGLARLDDRKARPGGAVNGGAPAPFILTIDGPGWGCYPAPPLVLPLALVLLPPGWEVGVFGGECGQNR